MLHITIDIPNPAPDTIYAKLKAKLGREPTHAELVVEVKRILNEH